MKSKYKKNIEYDKLFLSKLENMNPNVLNCLNQANIYTVEDVSNKNAEELFAILNKDYDFVAWLMLTYFKNNIPTESIDELINLADQYQKCKMQTMKTELEELEETLINGKERLIEIKSELSSVQRRLNEIVYTVISIEFADENGMKCEYMDAPKRLVTIKDKDDRLGTLLFDKKDIEDENLQTGSRIYLSKKE